MLDIQENNVQSPCINIATISKTSHAIANLQNIFKKNHDIIINLNVTITVKTQLCKDIMETTGFVDSNP